MVNGARSVRLLYVEDDRIHALLFEAAIAALPGVEVRIAESGAEALALAADWPPDVFVLDGHLPDMTGFALQQRLRIPYADVPVFMCSADGVPADTGAPHLAGFAGFWCKPVDAGIVTADLAAVLPPDRAAERLWPLG